MTSGLILSTHLSGYGQSRSLDSHICVSTGLGPAAEVGGHRKGSWPAFRGALFFFLKGLS